MSTYGAETRVGIVGAGRLGGALARRLCRSYLLDVCDRDGRVADKVADQCRARRSSFSEVCARCDVVLLCVHAPEVERLVFAEPTAQPLFVSMATDLDSEALAARADPTGPRLVALKLIGQFLAIEHGLPALFITRDQRPAEVALIRQVLVDVGRVEIGDDTHVSLLNRTVTAAALHFAEEFRRLFATDQVPDGWVDAALKCVLVGTILDDPPDPQNGYTRALLQRVPRDPALPDWLGSVRDAASPRPSDSDKSSPHLSS
jgi:hypothetical protein